MTVGQVLSPVFETDRRAPAADPRWDGSSYHLGSLDGLRVGIRDDVLWQSWGWVSNEWTPHLVAQGAELTTWTSETRGGAEAERSDKGLRTFLEGLDLAIVGLGTCGSCTMWTMHDALAAAERDIPTVAIVTEHFLPLAKGFAARAGRPDLPIFVLPYPLETRPEGEVRDIARAHLASLFALLGIVALSLTSTRVDTDLDPVAFTAFANEQGWGDGLPLIPATEALVQEFVDASGRPPEHVVATLETVASEFTVEKIAINAVMAGAAAAAMPLLCAAVAAMAEPAFDLPGVNATTASVVPALFVNGPIRDTLSIPYQASCFGGAAGPGPAIGRALRLLIRNVAGQRAGVTSESVFGQPARVSGIVVGEWEERSPWAPLAERLGVPGSAVTVYPTMGTASIVDLVAEQGDALLETIGKSLAYLGANNFLSQAIVREIAVAVNPTWATEILGRDFPDIADVQELLWQHASLPIDWFPARLRAGLEDVGRVLPSGRVHLVAEPDDVMVFVCGGLGGLHATMLHSFSGTHSVTRAVGDAGHTGD